MRDIDASNFKGITCTYAHCHKPVTCVTRTRMRGIFMQKESWVIVYGVNSGITSGQRTG